MKFNDTNLDRNGSNMTHDGSCGELQSYFNTPVHVTLITSLFLCVVGNSAICLIVARHYQLHTVTNANIVNMAIAHLLFSLVCVPAYLSILSKHQVSKWLCSIHGFFFVLFATGSALALVLIAFERHHVITKANTGKLSAKTTKEMILATWVMALCLSILWTIINYTPNVLRCTWLTRNHPSVLLRTQCLPFLYPPSSGLKQVVNTCLVIVCFILPVAGVIACYCTMAGPLWRGYNQVRPLGDGHPKTIRYTAEIRTARTMLMIFVLFLCCWGTFCYIAICNTLSFQFTQSNRESLTVVSICLVYSSFSFDPLIYALRNPRFSIMFRGRNRRRKQTRKTVKFSTSELAVDAGTQDNRVKWIHGRCNAVSVFETASKNDEFRVTSTSQTASTRLSGSTLSFSYTVSGVEESQTFS